ncbi:hypothetical protein N7478_004579 [Penicillium angulare]|uniref:uncharacterized protein n=1 Tax=Penicillium angulare TaxID=116970 RepID=UPI00253FAC67|nr:uncharacterized protein N7478_004579 [Penicillium angulare]KAJ5279207.1 hypothetical protein N7478_004579 [Penicillium angulare]
MPSGVRTGQPVLDELFYLYISSLTFESLSYNLISSPLSFRGSMAETIGITGGIIGIVTLAYHSTKTLYNFISDIANAPKHLHDLNEDVVAVTQILAAIKSVMEETLNEQISEGVKNTLKDAQPSIQGCDNACREFLKKISQITSHSNITRTRLDDRIKLQFQEKAILAFKYRIESYKSTLTIALGLATLKTSDRNSEAVRELEATITETISNISGKIQGLEISAQTISEFSLAKDELTATLNGHRKALAECLQLCTSALDETMHRTGNMTVRYVRALDDARQLIVSTVGDVNSGSGSIYADHIIAQGRADQMIAQAITQGVALNFFAPRR